MRENEHQPPARPSAVDLRFTFGKNAPPTDVLIEHLSFAIKHDFKETTLTDIRNHPFEGPEVFDDVQYEEYTGPRGFASGGVVEGGPTLEARRESGCLHPGCDDLNPWPNLTAAREELKKARREQGLGE